VLASSVWRIAACTFHAPIVRGGAVSDVTSSGVPGVPLWLYVILLSIVSELPAFTAVGLVSTSDHKLLEAPPARLMAGRIVNVLRPAPALLLASESYLRAVFVLTGYKRRPVEAGRHPARSARSPTTAIRVLLADDEPRGFLLKRSTAEDFVNAIRTVHEGESLLFPAAVRRLATRHGGPGGRGLAEANLTDREAEVLRLIAQGRSNVEIAAELFLGVETESGFIR
jgi:hypothetical protein